MINRRRFLSSGAALVTSSCRPPRATGFGGFAFVANSEERSVAAVDLTAFRVARQIRLDGAPAALVAHPARSAVYALMPQNGAVCEIDAATLQVKRKLSLGGTAIGMRLSSDSRFLWISTQSPHALVSVALDGFRVAARVKLPAAPEDFDLSKRGQLAAACFPRERSVALLDLEKNRVERQVAAGDDPRLVRFRFDGRQILVANRGERSLTILDVATGRVMVRLPLPVEPAQFCFKPDGGQLFVTGKGMDAVVIVHPYETEVSETILAGGAPGAMAVSAIPEYLFVANPDAGDVTILEVTTRRVLAAVTVGQQPSFITFTPDNQYALVVNHRSGDLAVIRMQSITQRRSRTAPLFTMIPVGSGPVSAAVIAV